MCPKRSFQDMKQQKGFHLVSCVCIELMICKHTLDDKLKFSVTITPIGLLLLF